MSKYSTLPDLDTQPDVYETPDSSETSGVGLHGHAREGSAFSDYSDDEEKEGLVRTSVSVSAASGKFESARPGIGNVDFSGRVGRRRREGYRRKGLPEQEEYEMLGAMRTTEKETPVQRLRRLMFEVEELGREIENVHPEGTLEQESQSTSGIGKKRERKGKTISHAQLLDQVSILQSDLAGMGRAFVDNSEPKDLDGKTAPGTPAKQMAEGKALLTQLKAFRNLSLSEEVADSTAAAVPIPTTTPEGADGSYVTYELFYTPESAKLTQLAKLTDVESRLASLERLIGTHFLQGLDGANESVTSLLQENGSLIGALQKLDNHLSLLTQPRQLDIVSRRVKTLAGEMERVVDLRKKQQLESSLTLSTENLLRSSVSALQDVEMHKAQTETERKINYLYETMEKLDPVARVIPHLVSRLRGLQSLHSEAAVFADSLKMLVQEQSRVGEGFKGIEDAVGRLEESVKANEIAVGKNVEALHGRIEALAGRVDKLMSSKS
ncbi:uncharacterized protein SPPG_05408 [Spizellomyces punctatus DAOM BR117]|uniref:Dynamitin n=1 Tax=Spizellomyces punctatus (strain DAOM BR117) TaxID=645134 RepID=A0A0L0HC91_SPIPD|nr:uncharacterized protein SPPG_05408 [Spizellomyces punctatus DAOM BR117]KNC99150.1 hypothetical protein SPPG_05408 [Spizellomyces punctatus DAOM BR117]|eukprot:XP_016607190.1 hypothetical protein SPPG_05408 [Spizellomyces punctatus DAOM BR117]